MQAKPPVKSLNELTHPNINHPSLAAGLSLAEKEPLDRIQISSSPPLTNGDENITIPMIIEREETPSPPQLASKSKDHNIVDIPKTPMQLSSPPGSPMKLSTRAKKLKSDNYGGLTSSVVKGQAASGLLELRNGAGDALGDSDGVSA
jgi:hypothetical protein